MRIVLRSNYTQASISYSKRGGKQPSACCVSLLWSVKGSHTHLIMIDLIIDFINANTALIGSLITLDIEDSDRDEDNDMGIVSALYSRAQSSTKVCDE